MIRTGTTKTITPGYSSGYSFIKPSATRCAYSTPQKESRDPPGDFASLDPRQLGQRVKVLIARTQHQRVLQRERRDPHVIGGNRGTLPAQLPVHRGIVVSGLVVGVEHSNARLQQETAKNGLVARPLTACREPGTQFSQHDKRQPHLIRMFHCLDNRRNVAAQISVAIAVECELHRHISSSIVSCAARALSKAASLRQVPAMSPKSRCRLRSPATPAPRAKAWTATSFRLFPCSRAALRRA